MPTASVDVGMPYVIWNRETEVPQLKFDYYEALILAQQMGGGYVTKYDKIAATPGHPLHNDPRLARVMAPYLGARKRAMVEAQSQSSLPLPTQEEIPSPDPITLGAPQTVTPVNDQMLVTTDNVLAQQAIDFNIPTVEPILRDPQTVTLPRLTQEEVPAPDPITLGDPQTVTPVNDQMLFTPKNMQAQQAIDFNIPTTPNLGQPETVVATDMAARYNPPVSPSTTPPTVGPIEDANALFARNLELQRQFDAEAAGHRLRNLSYRLGQDNRPMGEQIEAAAGVNEAARVKEAAKLREAAKIREEAQRANSQPPVSPAPVSQPPVSPAPVSQPPVSPANVVRDGFGNPIKAGDGYLRSRTDEEILRDEQDPYWWMR